MRHAPGIGAPWVKNGPVIALAYPRKKTLGDGEVFFPGLHSWNPVTMVATIVAEVDGARITCRIQNTVLEKKFHNSSQDPMRSVTEFRSVLELAAKKLIEKGKFEEDGSIMIRSGDL